MAYHLQFAPPVLDRDITKLYSALANLPGKDLSFALSNHLEHPSRIYATGHWGCGAFGGNKQLKAIQQIISASEAGTCNVHTVFIVTEIDLTYCCFGHADFEAEFRVFWDAINQVEGMTVSKLYEALISMHPRGKLLSFSRGNNCLGHNPPIFDMVRASISNLVAPPEESTAPTDDTTDNTPQQESEEVTEGDNPVVESETKEKEEVIEEEKPQEPKADDEIPTGVESPSEAFKFDHEDKH